MWNYLIFKKGGCLTGGQYVRKGKFGYEGCIMSNSLPWDVFFNRNKKEISNFILNKISNRSIGAKIHTCPFSAATEAEIAIYGLQRLYKINWYDFDEFTEFKNKEITSASENHQAWLKQILNNQFKRKQLINYWIQVIKN